MVWIFGIIGNVYGQEPGYHVYWLEPHLFTIIQHPIPVCIPPPPLEGSSQLTPQMYTKTEDGTWHSTPSAHTSTLGE